MQGQLNIDCARTSLASRGLRPVSELAAGRPHGDRLRYMSGCRCESCRAANTGYERARAAARKAGDWNGLVSADKARAHMASLSEKGVGRRAVGDASGVGDTVLTDIIAGRKTKIRARTERAILAVTTAAAADRALVCVKPTKRLIKELLNDGYSKAELARQLGYATAALQFKDTKITVRNAYDVERMYEKLRFCSAVETKKLLAKLRDEGYRLDRINAGVQRLAEARNLPPPDLVTEISEATKRARASTVNLVAILYEELTA